MKMYFVYIYCNFIYVCFCETRNNKETYISSQGRITMYVNTDDVLYY